MLKIAEGMYVRTKNNGICKLYREFHEDSVDVGIGVFPEIDGFFIDKEEINYIEKKDVLKASYNIIDLIKEGDYVNGKLVYYDEELECLGQNFVDADGNYYFESITKGGDDKIKTILTKEQYENNCYKVEE